jgi:2-iminobutanoate/2-iminopropanoate deaminase
MRAIRPLALACLLAACSRGDREMITAAPGAPPAIGPYSQAVRVSNTLYLAGQIGIDPETGAFAPGGIGPQTRRALENCRAVLEAAGFTLADVVQAQVFLEDIDDFADMNEVYATFFPQAPPARATVEVAELPRGARVEVMLTAVR